MTVFAAILPWEGTVGDREFQRGVKVLRLELLLGGLILRPLDGTLPRPS